MSAEPKRCGICRAKKLKDQAKDFVQKNLDSLAEAQELLYANDHYSVLIVFQAMDAGGKDSMIKHVMSGLNPQGCQVFSFKRPSEEELQHNFLWRYSKCLPERGNLGIFNRSYYEEVLVLRVHPELLEKQKLAVGKSEKNFWQNRYEDINNFERHLTRNGTIILKFFLNMSRAEQKNRLLARLEDPAKNWKFNIDDLAERACWPEYMKAFEKAIGATSTKWAPWYVIPADSKWLARAVVSAIIGHAIRALRLKPPQLRTEQLAGLVKATRLLKTEK